MCDDGTLPSDSYLAHYATLFFKCADKAGRSLKTIDTLRAAMERAGFVNIQEDYYKLPIGPWAKNEKLKEAGRIARDMWADGLEGYTLVFLTKFGVPRPWTHQEALVYTAKVRAEFKDPKYHTYHYM